MIELTHTVFGDEDCVHEFSDDWIFGGPNGTDPRADIRWSSSTYYYYDNRLQLLHLTQVPICDNAAIDYFSQVATYGSDYSPVYIHARRPDGSIEALSVRYDKLTDTFEEV